MRATKSQAKQQVEVYGSLLREYAVISEITTREVRGEIHYEFSVSDPKFEYPVECADVKQLAIVLTSMWSAYQKARTDLGCEWVE